MKSSKVNERINNVWISKKINYRIIIRFTLTLNAQLCSVSIKMKTNSNFTINLIKIITLFNSLQEKAETFTIVMLLKNLRIS